MCCRFFDAEGKPVRGVAHDRVLAIDLDELRAIPTVIGVATGVDKVPGVLGALRGGLVDGLVADAGLALALLDGAVPGPPRPERASSGPLEDPAPVPVQRRAPAGHPSAAVLEICTIVMHTHVGAIAEGV